MLLPGCYDDIFTFCEQANTKQILILFAFLSQQYKVKPFPILQRSLLDLWNRDHSAWTKLDLIEQDLSCNKEEEFQRSNETSQAKKKRNKQSCRVKFWPQMNCLNLAQSRGGWSTQQGPKNIQWGSSGNLRGRKPSWEPHALASYVRMFAIFRYSPHASCHVISFSPRETWTPVSLLFAFNTFSAQASTSLCPIHSNSFNWSYEKIKTLGWIIIYNNLLLIRRKLTSEYDQMRLTTKTNNYNKI